MIKKPVLRLIGCNGNAFKILGKAMKIAKQNGMDWNEIKTKAMSGDYSNLLNVMTEYFEVI